MLNDQIETKINKKWAITGFAISIICLFGLIVSRLINMSGGGSRDLREQQFTSRVTIVIAIILAFLSLTGLVVSIIGLIKPIRRPNVFGGKGFAITGLIVNGLFTLLFGITVILMVVGLLAKGTGGLADKPYNGSVPVGANRGPGTNSGSGTDAVNSSNSSNGWSYDTAYPRSKFVPIDELFRDFYLDSDKHAKITQFGQNRRRLSGTFASFSEIKDSDDLIVQFENLGAPIRNAKADIPISVQFRRGDADGVRALRKGQNFEFACVVSVKDDGLHLEFCSFNP